jgi:small membrane protein
MTPATTLLLGLVLCLLCYDWSSLRGRNRRALLLQILVFVGGAFFIAFPERATALAHLVGIGRGVDFLMYPIVIWLVRESLLTRRRRLEDGERITQLVRALAIAQACVPHGDASMGRYPAQSSGSSASLTT